MFFLPLVPEASLWEQVVHIFVPLRCLSGLAVARRLSVLTRVLPEWLNGSSWFSTPKATFGLLYTVVREFEYLQN